MNRNSALIWLPKVEELGIRSPKTRVITYSHHDLVGVLEGEKSSHTIISLLASIGDACLEIGYPCFLRTDLASAKHSGPSSYLITNIQSIQRILYRTVEDSEMKFWLTFPPEALLVRQFLKLDASFSAFDGLPIAREWRLFSDGEKILCAHPYWPKETIKFKGKPPKYWKKQLADHHVRPSKFNDLKKIAIRIARACEGRWSIDFAMDIYGIWWLIDMATMEDSWHWPGCKKERDKAVED